MEAEPTVKAKEAKTLAWLKLKDGRRVDIVLLHERAGLGDILITEGRQPARPRLCHLWPVGPLTSFCRAVR